MEIAYILLKSIEKDKNIFINKENNAETNKIFEDILKYDKDLFVLFKRSQSKEYFLINKLIYKKDFEDNIKTIIQQNFEIFLNSENNNQITISKKYLSLENISTNFSKSLFNEYFFPVKSIKVTLLT